MREIIADIHGNRRNVSNKPDMSNIILNMSDNRKNILDKHNNINSIISVPRSQILIRDNKKRNLPPQSYINAQTMSVKIDTKTVVPVNKSQPQNRQDKSEKKTLDKKQPTITKSSTKTSILANKSQPEKPL